MAASVDAAGTLELYFEAEGRRLPIAAVAEGRILVRDGGAEIPVPESGRWVLGGDLRASASVVYWSPQHALQRFDGPDREADAERAYFARGGPASAALGPNGYYGRPTVDPLRSAWPSDVEGESALVVAWVQRGAVARTVVTALSPKRAGNVLYRSFHISLSAEEASGQPVLLLWNGNGFVAAELYFGDDPATRRAIVASLMNDTEALRELIAGGFDVNAPIDVNLSLLHFAAEAGALDIVDLLLAARPRRSFPWDNPLHWAAASGRVEVVERLLQARFARDVEDAFRGTPLLRAAAGGHTEVVRVLLAAGANARKANSRLRAPLWEAIDRGYADIAEMLAQASARIDPHHDQMKRVLITQARLGHTAMVEWLVKRRVDPNFVHRGATALAAAAIVGDPRLAEVLLAGGADPNRTGPSGWTPLMAASAQGNGPFVRALVDAGADLERRTQNGNTALFIASVRNDGEIVELLLDRGADMERRNAHGLSALDGALLGGATEVARLLSERGAAVDPPEGLRDAVYSAILRFDVAPALASILRAGWPVDSLVAGSWPALRVAEISDADECTRLLREAGARVEPNTPVALVRPSELDAMPRITRAVPPEDPRLADETFPQQTVLIEFVVDPEGRPVFPKVLEAPDPRLVLPTLEVIPHWRLTPPTRGGLPVAARVRIPLTFPAASDRTFNGEDLDELPKAVKRVSPNYPASEKASGISARVVLEFLVGTDGVPREIRVVETTGPAFSDAALEAMREWRFEPGRRDGEPVATKMRQPMWFTLR